MLLKEKNNVTKTKNFLIIRLSSIGDILLTTSVIRQIRLKYPEAKISFVTKEIFSDLLLHNPHLDKIYTLKNKKTGLKLLLDELKKSKFDQVIDLHNNFRSNYIRYNLSYDNRFVYLKPILKRLLLVYFKLNKFTAPYSIPELYLKTIKKMGVTDDGKGLELFWPSKVDEELKKLTTSINQDYIVIAPGAGFFTKRWPIEYFADLITKIKKAWPEYSICVLGSADERILAEYLAEQEDDIHDFCGKLSLLQAASLIKKAKTIISNDSGLMHIATAVQTPVIAIFGSTVQEFGFFPFRAKHIVVENKQINCRPCSHVGKKNCPRKHFNCMREIKPEQVLNAVEKLINKK